MPQISIEEALKLPVKKPKKAKAPTIEEALAAPIVAPPSTSAPPAPTFLENLKIGGQRALLTAADAGRVMEDALGAAARGDFAPIGQLLEQAGRGVAPIVSALGGRPELAGQTFAAETIAQAPRQAEISAARQARMEADPESFAREAQAERARLDEAAGRDPSLAGKITRRATEGVLTAVPSVIAGAATGGSVPAMAGMAAIQSMNAPEMLIPNVALAATPLPVGKAIAPLIRRIRPGKGAPVPISPDLPDIPPAAITPDVPVVAPDLTPTAPPIALTPAQQEAAALNSAIQKLGTDSVDEIAEMIANGNRRFNRTVTVPGAKKRPITPAERQSMREDFQRISRLTKEENDALAGVLPERTFSPVRPGSPTARHVSDIPLDEPNAQLDANLRQLKAFFGSQDIVQESRIAAAVGQSASDPGRVRVADVGLSHVEPPTPMHAPDAVPVGRRISVDDIQLGRDELSKGRLFQAQENLKGGVRPETTGVRLKEQVQPIVVIPDPARPGKFIVTDDGNHRVALLKLQGVTDDIPVKSFETEAQTAAIRSAAGPRAGEVSPMEVEIGRQLQGAPRPPVARNMDPLEIESMAGAEQLPLLDVAQKNRLKSALGLMADLYQIPKSMMSSADISFPARQGFILLAPPSRWGLAKKTMVEMFRALIPDKPTSVRGAIKAQFATKTERYQRMVDAMASDLDAQTGMNSGLKLSSQESQPFRRADGEFMSDIANRVPVVRESQQAHTMAADHTRLNTFKLYKAAIDKRAAKEGLSSEQIKEGYKAAARWINIASGRGSFGEKADKALDAMSFFVFSPRFIASRIQVLNPLTYIRNAGTPLGREVLKMQMSEMAQLTAMVGGTLLLAKAAGLKVGRNPEKPDFLRISKGNYHYDGLAGLQPVMRLAYAIAADAGRIARGEKMESGERGALDVGARFLRGKAAPIPSYVIDFFDEKTFEGKPFDATRGAVERVTPMMWGDMVEAFQREGIGGPIKLSPGAIGFGAQFYEPKPIDAAIEARPSLLTELTRLQVRIRDPRRKPGESDQAYKGRQEAIANLYGRYGLSLMADRSYAQLPEQEKQEVFDLLHSRIQDAVNTRDPRTGQFQAEQLINSLRKSVRQKTIRERLISQRPPL